MFILACFDELHKFTSEGNLKEMDEDKAIEAFNNAVVLDPSTLVV